MTCLRIILPLLLLAVMAGARIAPAMLVNLGYVAWSSAWGGELAPRRPAALAAGPWWEMAWQLDACNRAALRGMGWALASRGRREEAVASWRGGGIDFKTFLGLGKVARFAGQPDAASEWFNLTADVFPSQREPWFLLAQVAEDRQAWLEARARYQTALARPDGRLGRSDIYFHLGWMAQKKDPAGNLESAWEFYEQALSADDFSKKLWASQTHQYRGQILTQQKRYDEALHAEEAALQAYPNSYYAAIELGYLYWLAKSDAITAEKALKQSIAQRPTEYTGYWYLAKVYEEAGWVEKSRAMHRKALALRPR